MIDWFEYNERPSFEFGIITTGLRTYGAPNRRVEAVHVPGKNGDLLIDEGTYDNIIVSYDIAIVQDFPVNAREIAQWLLGDGGYHVLTDSYNEEFYREATYFNAIEFDVESLKRQGKGTINFYAKPQRFAWAGGDQKKGNGTITLTNPYGFPAKPLIHVTGALTLTINGEDTITVSQVVDGRCYIDSETMQCYSGDTNCNQYVQMAEFPVIQPNETMTITISNAGTNTWTFIEPRYWRL